VLCSTAIRYLLGILACCVACGQPHLLRQQWDPSGDFGALLALHDQQFEAIEDLKLRARVSLRVDGRDERANALLLYAKPSMFRFEVRGPLFSHILTAVMLDDSLIVVTREGSWKGTADSILHGMIGIDVGEYDFGLLMLGAVQSARVDSNRAVDYPRADRATVPLASGDARRSVTVDLFRGFVVAERFESSRARWHRELTAYRRIGDAFLPGEMSIWQNGNHLALKYEEFQLNQGIDPQEFVRGVPIAAAARLPQID
jgi:hypothetical protein